MNNNKVEISPDAKAILFEWIELIETDRGADVANELIDAYEKVIILLENNYEVGTGNLKDLPKKYRALLLWKHLWIIYQTSENQGIVKIEYIIDDRQNYKLFVR